MNSIELLFDTKNNTRVKKNAPTNCKTRGKASINRTAQALQFFLRLRTFEIANLREQVANAAFRRSKKKFSYIIG